MIEAQDQKQNSNKQQFTQENNYNEQVELNKSHEVYSDVRGQLIVIFH